MDETTIGLFSFTALTITTPLLVSFFSIVFCVILVGLNSALAHFKLKNEKKNLLLARTKKQTDSKEVFFLYCRCQPTYIHDEICPLHSNALPPRMWKREKQRKQIHKIFSMLLLKLPCRSLYPSLPSNCNSLTDCC